MLLTKATLYIQYTLFSKTQQTVQQHPCLASTKEQRVAAGPVQPAAADSVEIRMKLEITQPISKTTRIHKC